MENEINRKAEKIAGLIFSNEAYENILLTIKNALKTTLKSGIKYGAARNSEFINISKEVKKRHIDNDFNEIKDDLSDIIDKNKHENN